MKPIMLPLILVGFGNVGRAFFRLVPEKKELCRRKYGIDLKIRAVFEIGGALVSPDELGPVEVQENSAADLPNNPLWKRGYRLEDALQPGAGGSLVECTVSNLETGEPGLTHIKTGLERGWHVATANKGPLVVEFKKLREMARKNAVSLKFSGATAAALPALDIGLNSLAGTEILSIEGILNGTTNYILTKMREGMSYELALHEARQKGIAERDPSLDVDGWDSAAKLLLIANAVMGLDLTLKEIRIEGIRDISIARIEQAKAEQKALKLLARVIRDGDRFQAEVRPCLLDAAHPLFALDGTNKGITFNTDTMGAVTITGGKSDPRGAAAALLKDIINIPR